MLPASMRKIAVIIPLLFAGVSSRGQAPNTNTAPTTITNLAAIVGTANTATNATRQLSLAEAIQMALQSNLDIQFVRYSPNIAQYSVSEALAFYEPQATFSYQKENFQSPGDIDVRGPLSGAHQEVTDFSGGLNGNGPQVGGYTPFGGNYSFGLDLRKTHDIPHNANFYNGSATIKASQPLLRNFWIDQPRTTIKINRVNLRISEEQLRQQVMDTLFQVEQAYYNLIFARENVKVQATALELASQLLRENRKRVEVGALAPLDEKQSEAEVAATRAALIEAERALSQQENILKGLITDKYADWNAVNLEPVENLVAVPALVDVQQSWGRGLRERADLLELKYALERAGYNLKLRKNQLWPELDVSGSYSHSELRHNYGEVLDNLPDGTFPAYSFGATLSIPLGNKAARSRYRSARALSDQALIDYKRLEQQIMVQIDDSVKLIRSAFERVEATRAARVFAEEALAAEQKKLENGKSTSFLVLQAQRDLTQRRSDEIRALADYNNGLAQLAWREGTTLERNNIQWKQ
jgi:outer membrane protein TolC